MTVNLFDVNFYRAINPDLGGFNDQQAWQHFQNFGLNEGRQFSPYVDLNLYGANNPDLAAAGLTSQRQLYEHLQTFGLAEGRRQFSLVFSAPFYQQTYSDLQAAGLNNQQLFEHFQTFGLNEGRQGSELFNVSFYLKANADLQAAGLNQQQALEHWRKFGMNEGRPSSETFSPIVYLTNNPDLQEAGFNYSQAFEHYRLFGIDEQRLSAPLIAPPVDPGDNLRSAFELGILSGNRRVQDSFNSLFVGDNIDSTDYYRFQVNAPNNVTLVLQKQDPSNVNVINLEANPGSPLLMGGGTTSIGKDRIRAEIESNSISQLLTSPAPPTPPNFKLIQDLNSNGRLDSGELIASRLFSGFNNNFSTISGTLLPGTYFVEINRESNFYNYQLSLWATQANPAVDNAGNSLAQARDLGVLNETQTFNDVLGLSDLNDFYRFSLNTPQEISLLLNGGDRNVNLSLIEDLNGNGVDEAKLDEQLNSVTSLNTPLKEIRQFLPPGTYFVKVEYGNTVGDADYNLRVSPTPSPVPPDNAGNIIAQARDLGILSGNRAIGDFLGDLVDSDDFYRFTLDIPTSINVVLDRQEGTNSIELQLIEDINGNGTVDANETIIRSATETIQKNLPTGSYLIRAYETGQGDVNYNLNVSASPFTPPPDNAGNNLEAARDVDIVTGTSFQQYRFNDSIGFYDFDDFYRFTLEKAANVSLSGSSVRNNSMLELIQDINGNGVVDPGEIIEQKDPDPLPPPSDTPFSSSPQSFGIGLARDLEPGTYFARMIQLTDDVNYDFSISVNYLDI